MGGLDLSHRESSELNFPLGNGKRERCAWKKHLLLLAGVEMRQRSQVGRRAPQSAARVGFYPLPPPLSPYLDACVYGESVGDPSVYQNVRERFSRPAARRIFYIYISGLGQLRRLTIFLEASPRLKNMKCVLHGKWSRLKPT